jgi:MFS family permease
MGAFAGPLIAGFVYDQTADYRPAFLFLAIGPLVALPLILSTRGAAKLQPAVSAST